MEPFRCPEGTSADMNMLRTALPDGTTLLMPNVWDVRSAQVALESGFSVVGTSSAAIAAVLGGGDAEQTSVDDMVGWNRRIVRAVSPSSVNVDLESGYGLSAAEIADVVRDIGCAGINIEDSNHDGDGSQLDRETQAIKLAEIGAHFEKIPGRPVLTARVDSMLDLIHEGAYGDSPLADGRVDDCIERALAYLHAGADVVFPIGLNSRRQFQRFFARVPARSTSLLIPFLDNRIDFVRGLGVTRISFGGTSRDASDDFFRHRLRRLGGDASPLRLAIRAGSGWLGRRLIPLNHGLENEG